MPDGSRARPRTGRRSLFLLGLRSLLAPVCIWTAAWSTAPAVAAAAAVVAVLGSVELGRPYDAALRHDLLRPGRPTTIRPTTIRPGRPPAVR